MKQLTTYLLLLITFSLFACKKNKPYVGMYELTVSVFDRFTGKPIPYAEIIIWEVEKAYIFASSVIVAGNLTNNDGIGTLYFHAKENSYTYKMGVFEDTNYARLSFSEYTEVSFDKSGKSTINVSLLPKGFLTFHIKGNKDVPIMVVSHDADVIGNSVFKSGVDTLITYRRKANKEAEIYYNLYDGKVSGKTKYGDLLSSNSIVTVPPLPPDTSFILIEF